MPEDEEYLKPKDLAERVGVSVSLIRKYMRNGELEYIEFSPKVGLTGPKLHIWPVERTKVEHNLC